MGFWQVFFAFFCQNIVEDPICLRNNLMTKHKERKIGLENDPNSGG